VLSSASTVADKILVAVGFRPNSKDLGLEALGVGAEVHAQDGTVHSFRRISVELNEPTRDGDREVHILTNLPRRVSAVRISEMYRGRWRIETAFQELAENLHGEIQTLGYPKAALFAFCIALLTYNLWSVLRASVHAVHGEEAADQLSTYYVADEVASTYSGMSIAVPATFWEEQYRHLSPAKMAKELKELARRMDLDRYRKGKWKPKKDRRKKPKAGTGHHVSTARVLRDSRGINFQ
jgi:hypothetical protein